MPFISLTVISVLLIALVLATLAPDKFIHFKDPGCTVVRSRSCRLVPYCENHRQRGDIFTPGGYFKSRGASEPENSDSYLTDTLLPSLPSVITTRIFDVIRKRAGSSLCGVLSCVNERQVSDHSIRLVAGVFYDLVIDYPY